MLRIDWTWPTKRWWPTLTNDDASYRAICELMSAYNDMIKLVNRPTFSSLRVTMENIFTKMLLLSTASHCEKLIHDLVVDLYRDQCNGGSNLAIFVEKQALDRQYHRLFMWDHSNANHFFQLFGSDFKKHMEGLIDNDISLRDNIRAFLSLGRERNKAVHQNLIMYSIDADVSDVFKRYEMACQFIEKISSELRDYAKKKNT